MPRFVILHHRTPESADKPDHFDLMLEDGDVLKTFTLWKFPSVNVSVKARPDFDHRVAYLDYEGPISDNRGHVTRSDSGTFTWLRREDRLVEVDLKGLKLQGILTLELQGESPGGAGSETLSGV